MATIKCWDGNDWINITLGKSGESGIRGSGLIAGGITNTKLRKKTSNDFDFEWVNNLNANEVTSGSLLVNNGGTDAKNTKDARINLITPPQSSINRVTQSASTSSGAISIFPTGTSTLSLDSNTTYFFEAFLNFNTIAGAGNSGLQFAMSFTQTPQQFEYYYDALPLFIQSFGLKGYVSTPTLSTLTGLDATNHPFSCKIDGWFTTNAINGGTVTPQTAPFGNRTVIINSGTWIKFTPYYQSNTIISNGTGVWS